MRWPARSLASPTEEGLSPWLDGRNTDAHGSMPAAPLRQDLVSLFALSVVPFAEDLPGPAAGAFCHRQRLRPDATTAGRVLPEPLPVPGVRERPDRRRRQPGHPVPLLHLCDAALPGAGQALPAGRRGTVAPLGCPARF